MSWIRLTTVFSDSLIKGPRFVLCHYCGVVLLVRVLLFFVEVDQLLVQRLIGQFDILQTSLDTVVFPVTILSSADVVQRIRDWCCVRV